MRVALIGPGTLSIPPNGWGATQRVVWNLHQHSHTAGLETVIVNSRGWEEVRDACHRFEPDLIHLHADSLLPACLPYLIARPTPLVVTSHDSQLATHTAPDVALAVKSADAAIALSPAIRQRLNPMRPGAVHYVPNGVDTRIFRPLAKKRNTVMAVGRNGPRKRFAEIARFFLARPDYQLTLCGPEMRSPGGRYPLIPTGPNITILGNMPESTVARLLGESEYFVHFCEQEASALVVREAMACGCRVWTVPANAEDLRNVALSWEDAVADTDLGNRAAREARESLDWSFIVRKHADVYEQTLARWRGSADAAPDAQRRYRMLAAQQATWGARLERLRHKIEQRVRRRLAAVLRRR